MKNFLKGIIVGIGGIAPGLSGSVLMVILGLYSNVINAIATLFKDFKKNMKYLIPIGIGMVIGVILFSRLINFSLFKWEIPTRLLFLGLIIGTIPLFYKETKKENNTKPHHYILMLIAFCIGLYLFTFNNQLFSPITDLNWFMAFVLGFVGIMAMIIPGIDGAATLSALGLYEKWLDLTSITSFDLNIYIPAGLGMIACAFLLSMFINIMIKKYYTATFSVLFGFFLSIIPTVLKLSDGSGWISLSNNITTYVGILLFLVGVLSSFFFSRLEENKDFFKKIIKYLKKPKKAISSDEEK